ncbi:MAG: polysaccharide ABC transporter ATP-binding protein [bacterium]
MSDIAIRCEHLSKQYRIGERESYKALRDVITDGVSSPFRKLRSALRNGSASSNGSDSALSTQHSSLPSEIRNPNSESRNSFWALDDVSFEVKRGEVLGIIGRNGAGKSTLLKILSRITKPTKGHADIHGRVASLLEVGTGFHPELTGRENIYLNAAILGMRKAEVERNFDEIVAFSEVEKFIDTPVKRYSSGMYVRLAFAVAAHLEPEILIVDEVLAVGDAAFQKKCLGKMNDVAKAGRTVLFVSHNMGAIQRLCNRCMLVDTGRLSVDGDPRTVVPDYLSLAHHTGRFEQFNIRNQDCEVRFSVMDESGNPTKIWHFGQKLTVKVAISTRVPLIRPAVDISFHSDIQARLFAFQSDKLGQGPDKIEGTWNITFEIENPGLTVAEMYFDIGVRQKSEPYIVLIREAERLFSDYSSAPTASLHDCLLYTTAKHSWEAGSEN